MLLCDPDFPERSAAAFGATFMELIFPGKLLAAWGTKVVITL